MSTRRRVKKKDQSPIRRFIKRSTLESNKARGVLTEGVFALDERLKGNDVRRIHRGGDFVVQKRDFWGRKIGEPKTYEIKTGNSKLSDAQERMKKKLKGNYKVVRH